MLFLLITKISHGWRLPPEGLLDALISSSLIRAFDTGEVTKSLIDLLEEIASETFIVKLLPVLLVKNIFCNYASKYKKISHISS
jgi:hypothetical protein